MEKKISTMSSLPLRRADEKERYGAKNVGARVDTHELRGFLAINACHMALSIHTANSPLPPPTAPLGSALVGKKGC